MAQPAPLLTLGIGIGGSVLYALTGGLDIGAVVVPPEEPCGIVTVIVPGSSGGLVNMMVPGSSGGLVTIIVPGCD